MAVHDHHIEVIECNNDGELDFRILSRFLFEEDIKNGELKEVINKKVINDT